MNTISTGTRTGGDVSDRRRAGGIAFAGTLAMALLSVAMMPGCETTPTRERDAEESRLAYNDGLIGQWRSEGGDHLAVRAEKDWYRLDSTPADGDPWTAPAMLRMIGGGPIVELTLSRETVKDAAPVVHYARLWVDDRDRLIHQPLRAGWLEREANRTEGLELGSLVPFSETPSARATTAVGSPARMRSLLRRAQQDPAAWGTAEVFTRVR